jgi:hypothetical protein
MSNTNPSNFQELIDEFVLISRSNAELANEFLETHGWSLGPSVDAFFATDTNKESYVDLTKDYERTEDTPSLKVSDYQVLETRDDIPSPSTMQIKPEGDVSKMSVKELKSEIDRSGLSTANLFTLSDLRNRVEMMRARPSSGDGGVDREAMAVGMRQQRSSTLEFMNAGASVRGNLFGARESKSSTTQMRMEDKKCEASTLPSRTGDFMSPWSGFGNKEALSCIVIGETGAGKSTVVNTCTNFFEGGSLDNLKIAIPTKYHKQTERAFQHTELNVQDRSQSSTDNCTTYTFQHAETCRKFIVIDTPGLADTRGSEQDSRNIERILKAAEDAHTLSAIVLVVNGANPRYTQAIDLSSIV